VIALQTQRSGAIRSIAGGAGALWTNIHIIEDLLCVMNHREAPADEGNIECLPLTRRLRGINSRGYTVKRMGTTVAVRVGAVGNGLVTEKFG